MPEATPYQPVRSSSPQPEPEAPSSSEMPDTPMVDAPPVEPEPPSHSQPESESQPEPPPPDPEAMPEEPVPAPLSLEPPPLEVPEIPSQDNMDTLPPPPDPRIDHPEWVLFDEDQSKPTPEEEEELKLRESRGTELSGVDVAAVEKRIYSEVEHPDARPIKKLRLSWIIKGVRGTKEKPNYARVMVSPLILVDGTYWQIKFYPRGNKASSYSTYIRGSKKPPKSDREIPEGDFMYFEGPADADFVTPGAVPAQVPVRQAAVKRDERSDSTSSEPSTVSRKQNDPATPEAAPTNDRETQPDEAQDVPNVQEPGEDWRISAQLGVVMYNPKEPRTCAYATSEHQFSRHTDDWGWCNVTGPWRETHMRQHLQRAPLLQDDTLAIDAHIRIFDDSTKALWWRSSDGEPHWDSKSLAGYFPMGTPPLYHSPAVAGMTAWLLLAPFRNLLQATDTSGWRRDSRVRPKPLITQLQMVLFLMRELKKERENYVDLYPTIRAMPAGEQYTDVTTFWESFRRLIELEVEGDGESLRRLSAIFDAPNGPVTIPPLPVENILDIQQSLGRVLREKSFRGALPDFLPLTLARDHFDNKSREWKLLYDRVILNEELDVSEFVDDAEQARYTLYGFMVHAGARNSGKFYAILRPNGPNGMWLAFEDGDGNQVFSYGKKSLKTFEGLEGQALKDLNSTRSTAYMAMYIKTSRLGAYLPGKLDSYKLPRWLSHCLQSPHNEAGDKFEEDSTPEQAEDIEIEVYYDAGIIGRDGLLNMYSVRQHLNQDFFYTLRSPITATYQDVRRQLAQKLGVEKVETIRLFGMSYGGTGNYEASQLSHLKLKECVGDSRKSGEPLCLWMSILTSKEDIDLFGEPDKPDVEVVVERPEAGREVTVSESAPNNADEQVAGPDAEQESIRAAVAADIARASSGEQQPSAVTVEIQDPDTPMQLEPLAPSAEEPMNIEVPHGHLIDAAAHDNNAVDIMDNAASQDDPAAAAPALPLAEEEITAAAIADHGEGMDVPMESGSESTDRSGSQSSESSSQSSSPPPERDERPVDATYGLIQSFDAESQKVRVESTFFAQYDDKVRDFVQKRVGYGQEENFTVWRPTSTTEGSFVGADETFRDFRFLHGSGLVCYKPVSESGVKKLEKEGKFTTPSDLFKYLLAVQKRHPIYSKTTSEDIELANFGTDYYKGPLLNGRCHGAQCLSISSSGNTYKGPLVCGVKSGKGGKMTYCNGDTYEGEWYKDERHGQGTFVEARTGNKYVGGFETGKRWGMGTTYWQVADEQADLCQICYGQEIDALFFDCGHVCACVDCSKQCELCPICRKPVKQVVKMFRS